MVPSPTSSSMIALPLVRNLMILLALIATIISVSVQFQLEFPTLDLAMTSERPLPRLSPENSPPWAIFYNIFIHHKKKGRKIALDIIREQIAQIGNTFAARHYENKQVILFYNTIGGTIESSWMQQLCRAARIKCRHMQHYPHGHEDLTLNRVHEFCVTNPDLQVIYVHTKGTFHYDGSGPGFDGQDRWRRHMTEAATSQYCLEEAPSNTCNTCGMLFQPLPTEHFPGNSWSAQCSYIRQLYPPKELRKRRDNMLKSLPNTTALAMKYFPVAPPYLGTERYLAEHWVGTHPAIMPCDLSNEVNLGYWLWYDHNYSDFHFNVAPRFDFDQNWAFQAAVQNEAVKTDAKLRIQEFFLLPGHLHRWFVEYNATPSQDSWVWKWYPDGERLRQAVNQHWNRAVEIVIKESLNSRSQSIID